MLLDPDQEVPDLIPCCLHFRRTGHSKNNPSRAALTAWDETSGHMITECVHLLERGSIWNFNLLGLTLALLFIDPWLLLTLVIQEFNSF